MEVLTVDSFWDGFLVFTQLIFHQRKKKNTILFLFVLKIENAIYLSQRQRRKRKKLNMAQVVYLGLPFPAELHKKGAASSSPSSNLKPPQRLKLANKTRTSNSNLSVSTTSKGNNKTNFTTSLLQCYYFIDATITQNSKTIKIETFRWCQSLAQNPEAEFRGFSS